MFQKIGLNFLIQGVSKIALLVLMFYLGKFGGPRLLGEVSFTLSMMGIVGILSISGMDRYLLQKAAYIFVNSETLNRGEVYPEYGVVVLNAAILGPVICVLLFCSLSTVDFQLEHGENYCFLAGMILLHPIVSLNSHVLNAAKKVNLSQLLSQNCVHMGVLLVLATRKMLGFTSINLDQILGAYFFSYLGTCLIGARFLWQLTSQSESWRISYVRIIRRGFPFFLMGALPVISFNVDKLFMAIFRGNDELGIYELASRLGNVTSFLLLISLSVFSPLLAEAKSTQKTNELFKAINKYVRIVAVLGCCYVTFVLVFGKSILTLWGPEYQQGYVALVTCALAQLVVTLTGPVGTMLTMCGHEKTYSELLLVSCGSLVVLDLIFIPLYGLTGAAVAVLVSSLLLSALRARAAYKLEGYSLFI